MTLTAQRELLKFYSALALERHDLPGATVLHTPGSALIGANAAYAETPEGAEAARAWMLERGAPPVLATPLPPRDAQEVLRLHVGTYHPQPVHGNVQVEQVSRLQLGTFAEVLCDAWGMPEWATALNRTLARALEFRRDFTLLLAYADEPVGALLAFGGAAHLWGTASPATLQALLNAASELTGGSVRTSFTPAVHLPTRDTTSTAFWLGDNSSESRQE